MIPILYKQSEKAFKSNGIGRLADAKSCIVHERRNEAFDLEMTYPSNGRYAKELKVGRIIFATHDNSRKPQAFDIASVSAESNGQIRVTGEHISRRLKGILTKLNHMWWTELDTVQFFFKDLNDKTSTGYIIGACDFTFHTDVSNAKRGYSPKSSSFISVFDHLTDAQYGLLSVENGVGVDADYRWDMYDVSLLKHRGAYRGVKMRTGKNVKTLTVEENNKHRISGVLAFWHGNDPITGKDRTVTMTGDMASVEDKTDFGKPEDILLTDTLASEEPLPYQKVEVLDVSSKFTYPPKPTQVREEAQFYLDQQSEFYAKGSSSYSVDLAYDTTGTASMQTADLCDWVIVEDVGMRVQKKLQVTEVWYDTLRDRYTSMTVGLLPRTFKQLVHKESAPVNQKSDNLTSQVKDLAEKTDVENKVYPTGYDPKHPESWTNPGGELTDAEGNKVEQVATINRRPVFVKTVGGGGSSCDLSLCIASDSFVIYQAELLKVFTDYHDVKLCYKGATSPAQTFIGSQVATTIKRIVVSELSEQFPACSNFILKEKTWTTAVLHGVMLETTIKDGNNTDMKFFGDLRLSMKKVGTSVDVLIEQFTSIDEHCKGQTCILTARVQAGFPFLPIRKLVAVVTPT